MKTVALVKLFATFKKLTVVFHLLLCPAFFFFFLRFLTGIYNLLKNSVTSPHYWYTDSQRLHFKVYVLILLNYFDQLIIRKFFIEKIKLNIILNSRENYHNFSEC